MGADVFANQKVLDKLKQATVANTPALPLPPSPTSTDPAAAKAAQDAMEAAAANERKQRGRASTLLTGGAGLQSGATVSRRMLLGS